MEFIVDKRKDLSFIGPEFSSILNSDDEAKIHVRIIVCFDFKEMEFEYPNIHTLVYKDFEKELVTGAQNYYVIKNLDIDDGEEKKITLKTLSDSNLVYSDLKDKCSGYVIITNEEDFSTEKYKLNYNAYIKCGRKYMTANYSEY